MTFGKRSPGGVADAPSPAEPGAAQATPGILLDRNFMSFGKRSKAPASFQRDFMTFGKRASAEGFEREFMTFGKRFYTFRVFWVVS